MAGNAYICGPSVLRLPDRVSAIVPGDRFEYAFPPAQEASLLACGAIRLAPEIAAAPQVPEAAPASEPVSEENVEPARPSRRRSSVTQKE